MDNKNLIRVATILVIVGAINWMLVGINRDYNLVHNIVGDPKSDEINLMEKTVYLLVGLSGLFLLYDIVVNKKDF